MTKKVLRFFLLFIVFVAVDPTVFASEVSYRMLSRSNLHYRHFLQINEENGLFKVIELEQQRGDFPYILSRHQFDDPNALKRYLDRLHAQSLKSTKKLEDWGLQTPIEDSNKRNTNLWPATQQWSEHWEEELAKWVEENVKEDFFVKYGLATDCADAILGIRWIFARIHGLPVANHTSVSNSLFTNYSVPSRWRNIPKAKLWHEDRLFKTALDYIMSLGSTRTVLLDSYPLALTKQGLLSGAFSIIKNPGSNHAKLISENHFDGPTELPLFTLASTVPRQVRYLVREAVTDEGWPVEGEKSFLNFRWPIVSGSKVYLKSASSHSDYSREQYDLELRTQHPVFIEFLLGRLKDAYDPQNLIQMAVEDILNYTQQRIDVVAQGAAYCAQHDCSYGTNNWEDWSTPSRDKKLKAKFTNIDVLAAQFEDISPGLIEKWRRAQFETMVPILGHNLSLKTIRYLLESGKASSDPNVSI